MKHLDAGAARDRAATFRPTAFRPARGLGAAHVQTLAGKLLRPDPEITFRRERWDTPDGDFLDVDFADLAAGPTVLVLHGLEGSARRRYAKLTYRALGRRGLSPVGLNFRSCSGEPNRLPRAYHSGETGDLEHVLEKLHRRGAGAPLGAIGFSLGGNVLLKLLGELGPRGAELIGAAAVISVPFDLSAGSDALESSLMGRVYSLYFLRMLREKTRRKRDLLAPHVDVDRVLAVRTLRGFDELATAPLHGFRSAAHYYEASSSDSYLSGIEVPTLVLHALDDPFLPARAVPRTALDANPFLFPVLTRKGGHVGFVSGSMWSPGFWAEREAARFLAHVLAGTNPGP